MLSGLLEVKSIRLSDIGITDSDPGYADTWSVRLREYSDNGYVWAVGCARWGMFINFESTARDREEAVSMIRRAVKIYETGQRSVDA